MVKFMTAFLILLVLSFILLIANAKAYQDCNGNYAPYPVKCVGGAGSGNTASQQSSSTQSLDISSLTQIILIIAGVLVIIYFGKKILFNRRKC